MISQDFPNAGTLWYQDEKTNPKAPDFKGSIGVDREYLKQLLNEQQDNVVEIKIDGWRSKIEISGEQKPVIRMSVNTWKPDPNKKKYNSSVDNFPF